MSLYAFATALELEAAPALRAEGWTAFAIMMMDRRKINRAVRKSTAYEPEAVRGIAHYVFVECGEADVFTLKRKFPALRPVVHSNGKCYPLRERSRQALWNKRALWTFDEFPLLHDTDRDIGRELFKLRRDPPLVERGQNVKFSLIGLDFETEVLQTRWETADDGHRLFLKLEALNRVLWIPAEDVKKVEEPAREAA